MPTTIIAIVFSIYTLILIGTLILLLKSDDSVYQKNKKILANSVRTQGRITEIYHPQRKRKWKNKTNSTSMTEEEKTSNDTETYRIVVGYEYEVKETETTTKTLLGESYVNLDIRNASIMKKRYKVGAPIDLLYLKDEPTLVGIAHYVTPIKGDNMFIIANITALLSSLLVLGLLAFVGLSENTNRISDALGIIFGFLMYVFLMFGSVAILFAGIFVVKGYFQFLQLKKKGIKEKGTVLETWEMRQSRGGVSYSVRYTHPAIAPFSIETTVTRKLNKVIQKNKSIEVLYLKTDKFFSEIVGNKSASNGFWLFLILMPMISLFVAWIFYESTLRVFCPL